MNNINMEAASKFLEEAKVDPGVAKKTKRVEGDWAFAPDKPQFRATLAFKEGAQIIESDFAPFMGGHGLAPDPIQYCLYGLAACYAGTFVMLATQAGIALDALRISVENKVDLSRTLGLSDRPIVEGVEIVLEVATAAPREQLEEIDAMAKERCPGAYCLTHPIKLSTRVASDIKQ